MSKKKTEHTLFDGDRLIKKPLPLKKINLSGKKPKNKTKEKQNEN